MSDLINLHKRNAMFGGDEALHLKKGGGVKKYAAGGGVLKSSPIKPDFKAGSAKIATMKRGGGARGR
jgi:hypothetical protein